MADRLVVDPITRIEGHLRIEADIENGFIKDAYSSGTMIRGIEDILHDREARDAWVFAGRVCGVCTSMHSLASVRCVENAYNIQVPPDAEYIRNIMQCVLFLHDHVVHFYQLQIFDWVDVVSALKADPVKAAEIATKLSAWPKNSVAYYTALKAKLQKFVDSGQLGIFTNGYWGNPAYKLSPEENLIGTGHYLDALDWQKEVVKVQTVFGGKNPHPNYLVGGMACAIDLQQANAINQARLDLVKQKLDDALTFVEQVLMPDTLMIGRTYKNFGWFDYGGGVRNYLCYGDFPTTHFGDVESYLSPRGVVLDRDISKLVPVDDDVNKEIQEFITHAWYSYKQGNNVGLHPYEGETVLNYTGPKPPYQYLDVEKAYSWIKTPRWNGLPMEVGPLARLIVGYAAKAPEQTEIVDKYLKDLGLPFEAMYSTLARLSARAMECVLAAKWALRFYDMLIANLKNGDNRTFNPYLWQKNIKPEKTQGFSANEAPRGALGHFAVIEKGRIKNYQMVVPTTWNGSPRDEKGQRSPFEASLIGNPLPDPKAPIEILRTIHSFDPCLACAVHLYDEEGKYVHQMEMF